MTMLGRFPFGETITITRWLRDDRNAHGQLTPVFDDPVEIRGVGVDVPSNAEPVDGLSQRHVSDAKIFLPPGESVDHRDKIELRGANYEVEGDAQPIRNFFTGTVFPTEVDLKRVTG